MYISGFTVAGFGRLRPQTLEGLSAGLNIFSGANEAGKTTCLEFFRTMLCGYPDRRRTKERRFPPLYGSAEGGTILLEEHGLSGLAAGPLALSRKQADKSPLLRDAAGADIEALALDRLFGGVTRGLYHSVYGFSLKELQDFSSISDSDEVRHALYGASFGLTARPPAEIIRRLEDSMDAIFTVRGQKNQTTRALLARLAEVREALRRHDLDAPRYDAWQEELAGVEGELARLRADLAERGGALRGDERLSAAWPQWEELLQIEARLALPELAIAAFPPDALPRLERCLEKREQARQNAMAANDRHERLRTALADPAPDPALAACLPEARALAERKVSYRAAQGGLSGVAADLNRTGAERDRSLAVLGPDWTIKRVSAFDRSLFTHEGIAAHERRLRAAESTRERAAALLEQALAEGAAARRGLEHAEAEAAQAAVSEMDAALNALVPERLEQLRVLRAQAEFAVAGLPALNDERRRGEERLTAALREISPLWTAETLGAHVLTPALRAHGLSLAREQTRAARAREEAAQALNLERIRLEELEERRGRLLARNNPDAPSTADIEARGQALSALRRLPAELSLAGERLERAERDLTGHDAGRPLPQPRGKLAALGVAALCLCLLTPLPLLLDRSGLLPAARAIELLAGTAPILISLHTSLLSAGSALGASGIFLLLGLTLLWTGWPRVRPEILRQFEERRLVLATAREQAALALDALESRLIRLLDAALVPEFTDLALRAAEADLERDRRERGRLDQLALALAECAGELEKAAGQYAARQKPLDFAEQAERDAQSAWREHLAGLALPLETAPGEAAALHDRIGAAHVLAGQSRGVLDQIAACRESVRRLAAHAASLPGLSEQLAGGPDSAESPADLFPPLDAWLGQVRRAQDHCREYERRRAVALAQAEQAQRLALAARKAEDDLRGVEAESAAANLAWQDWLTKSGLADSLAPETARQALETMERCLRLHGEAEALEARKSALLHDISAVEAPLSGLLFRLDRAAPAPASPSGASFDALAALDQLLADAEQAAALREERDRLELQLNEAGQALREAGNSLEAAEKALADLLASGESADEEDFRRRAAAFAEREASLRRAGDLGVTLRLAAGTDSVEQAAGRFSAVDQAALAERMRAAASIVRELTARENACVDKAADLRAALAALLAQSQAASLRREEAGLREDLRVQALEWARLALARHLITTAKRRFEQERQPDVVRRAGRIFAEITDARWLGVSASLDDANLSVLDSARAPLANDLLSRGAQEQLYLAMRLAYLQDHARRSQPLPLIMDDILVNFDPERAARTARVLAQAAAGDASNPGHQILFFTCHPETAELLAAAPKAARFTVEDGLVRRL